MSLFGRLKRRGYEWVFDPKVDAKLVDESINHLIMDSMPQGPMIRVEPNKDDNGIEKAPNLIDTFYTLRTGQFGIKNRSPVHAFELWYDDAKTQFRFLPGDDTLRTRIEDQIGDSYSGASVSPDTEMFPTITEGDFIAGAKMNLFQEFYQPIKRTGGKEGWDDDPYGRLISEMEVGQETTPSGKILRSEDVRMIVQVIFQPCKRSWGEGGVDKYLGLSVDCDTKADEMRDETYKSGLFGFGAKEIDSTRKHKKASDQIAKQRGEPGFWGQVRVFAISPFESVAKHRTKQISEILETAFYNKHTEQRLDAHPLRGEALERVLRRTVTRQLGHSVWPYGLPLWSKLGTHKTLFTPAEMAGLVHLPGNEVTSDSVDWSLETTSPGVPPDVESFKPPNTEEGAPKQ